MLYEEYVQGNSQENSLDNSEIYSMDKKFDEIVRDQVKSHRTRYKYIEIVLEI
jgi:hypothetical protein